MRAGTLDRSITIEQPTETADANGQAVQSWTTYLATRADWIPLTSNDRFKAAAVHAVEAGKFRIRYSQGVTEKMRIAFDGKYYKIIGLMEIERRRGLEIAVELWK